MAAIGSGVFRPLDHHTSDLPSTDLDRKSFVMTHREKFLGLRTPESVERRGCQEPEGEESGEGGEGRGAEGCVGVAVWFWFLVWRAWGVGICFGLFS